MKNYIKKFRHFLNNGPRLTRFLKKFSFLIVVLLFLTAITAQITSRPSFCPTCHYMQTFYDSWRNSKHKDITCVKCHFEPGLAGTVRGKLEGLVQVIKYVSQAYRKSKPWAEIPDASCLQSGCHETRLLNGLVTYKKVAFDHSVHLTEQKRNKTLRCTSCHSQIVQGAHMTVTPETCFLCHFKQSEYTSPADYKKISNCTNCHRWNMMTSQELMKYRYNHTKVIEQKIECVKCHNSVISGTGNVPKQNCFGCHWEQWRIEKYSDLNFVHKKHIEEHRVECSRCHINIEHRINKVSSETSPECNTCHKGKHQNQVTLYTGHGGKQVEDSPSPMFNTGLNCAGCHLFHSTAIEKGKVGDARGQSCEGCHGKGYARLLKNWEEVSARRLKEVKSVLVSATSEINRANSPNKIAADSILKDALYNIDIVEKGKGVHNVEYTEKLLYGSYNLIKNALDIVHSNYKLPVFKVSNDSIPSECVNCHYGLAEKTVDIYGLKFSHRIHVVNNKLKCLNCHSNATKHGELIIKKESCTTCHHSSSDRLNCIKCHALQTNFYNGSYGNLNSPDIMRAAEVKCIDCHIREGEKIIRPQKQECLKCHDPNYENKIPLWQNQIRQSLVDIKSIIDKISVTKLNDNLQNKIKQVNKLIDDINQDRSFGAHNFEMMNGLLNDYRKFIQENSK